MTRLSRRDLTLAFTICLVAIAWACSARSPHERPPANPVSTPPAGPPEAVERPGPTPTAAPASPVERAVTHDEADCALIREPGEAIATVALGESVDPAHAPYPTNDSERLLFRQVYETLVRADCHGHAAAALATGWRLEADGRTWIVTLRDGARFSDGTPLTASDVGDSWAQDGDRQTLRPRVSRLVQAIVPLDNRTLAITLHSRRVDAPIVLAHTDLAIARPVKGSRWPLGTREDRASVQPGEPVGASTTAIAIERANLPQVRFLVAPGDPRDLLDRGADLLVTQDAAALAYAAALPQLQSVPLAWNRTLALIAPGRSRPSAQLAPDAREELARDAIRGEARGAVGPFWWETTECDVPPPTPRPRLPFTPRVVSDAGNGAARDLAERIVALSRASNTSAVLLDALLPNRPDRSYQRATALSGEAFSRARRLGNDAAYVAAFDARPLDPCRELEVLSEAMPWLDPTTVVPLVDTRPRAIVKKGRAGLAVEWDGAMLIGGTGAQR